MLEKLYNGTNYVLDRIPSWILYLLMLLVFGSILDSLYWQYEQKRDERRHPFDPSTLFKTDYEEKANFSDRI